MKQDHNIAKQPLEDYIIYLVFSIIRSVLITLFKENLGMHFF
jgi:hypothetical protein